MGWYSYNPKDVVNIYEDKYVAVDYNKSGKIYRVTIYEDGHFKDEFWFDEYKADKENRMTTLPRVIEKPCYDCGYYGWDMPQCGDCYQNGKWIYFNDRYRDIDDE